MELTPGYFPRWLGHLLVSGMNPVLENQLKRSSRVPSSRSLCESSRHSEMKEVKADFPLSKGVTFLISTLAKVTRTSILGLRL